LLLSDLYYCKRAKILTMRYSALKQVDKNADLIKEVEEILSLLGTKTKSVRDVGDEYGLSRNTVARYLRVAELIPKLRVRLDGEGIGDKLSMRTAVSLSYLHESEQKILNGLLEGLSWNIDMRKAEALRKESEARELALEDIRLLLSDSASKERRRSVRISESIYSSYFGEDDSADEISEVIENALRMWSDRQT